MRGAPRWSIISSRTAASLSEDSVARLERNPLRILDSKDAKDQRDLRRRARTSTNI